MKSSYAALGILGLVLAGLWFAGGGAAVPPQSAAAAEQLRVSSPLAHENLTVYFVHGPDAVADAQVITLQEALEAGLAVVHETGDVNTLAVENLSPEYELFIQDGEMIRGGKQDRMIAVDMLLPPGSGRISFPAHCVESGRWTARGGEATTHFNKSDNFAVGNELRLANASYQQSEVWENVKKNQDKLSRNLGVKVNDRASETSFQLALENRTLQAKIGEFEQRLKSAGESRKNVVGVVFVVNGQVTAAEVYGSNALFKKAWPKLLRAAATEAVAEKTDKQTPHAPSTKEVERFLACGGNTTSAAPDAGVSNHGGMNRVEVDAEADVQRLQHEVRQLNEPINNVQLVGGRGRAANNPWINTDNVPQNDRGQAAVSQLLNPDGNRLNINRMDNPAAMVTESRDSGRGNAVIHRSYLKK